MNNPKLVILSLTVAVSIAAVGAFNAIQDEAVHSPAHASAGSSSQGYSSGTTAGALSPAGSACHTSSYSASSDVAPSDTRSFSAAATQSEATITSAALDGGNTANSGPALAAIVDRTPSNVNFQAPVGIAVDASGNLYVTDASRHVVRKITPQLAVSTWAGSSGVSGNQSGIGTASRFNAPKGIAIASDGNLVVADSGNSQLRKVTAAGGVVTTIGNVQGDSVAIDGAGDYFVADSTANLVRKLSSSGATLVTHSGVTSSNSGFGKISRCIITGDIDPIDPEFRLIRNPRGTFGGPGQDQASGLAPTNIFGGIYGARVVLTESSPVSISYSATDFPFTSSWWSHLLPYTATYGTSWVMPVVPYVTGTTPPGDTSDASYDSQSWRNSFYWTKIDRELVRFEMHGSGSPEVQGGIARIYRLTFTTPNSGTFTAQYGLLPTGVVIYPGITELAKVLSVSSGTFVIDRILKITPAAENAQATWAEWVE